MNAGTLTEQERVPIHKRREDRLTEVVDFTPADARRPEGHKQGGRRSGIFEFISELRRRRVCRAVTTYCVALWLVCQVVEIMSPSVGLPDWTLQLVIVQGLLGFPIAVIVSWLFDVTPNGLLLDRKSSDPGSAVADKAPARRVDRAIDCGLLAVALVIGGQMALSAISGDSEASPLPVERIAVLPFPVASAAQADAVSAALLIELQHELARQGSVTVVASGDPSRVRDGSSLTGAVVVRDGQVRVTAIMIDNRSGEVTWSELFELTYTDVGTIPSAIARTIVEAWAAPTGPSRFEAMVLAPAHNDPDPTPRYGT